MTNCQLKMGMENGRKKYGNSAPIFFVFLVYRDSYVCKIKLHSNKMSSLHKFNGKHSKRGRLYFSISESSYGVRNYPPWGFN